jgi:hypothetical protein
MNPFTPRSQLTQLSRATETAENQIWFTFVLKLEEATETAENQRNFNTGAKA